MRGQPQDPENKPRVQETEPTHRCALIPFPRGTTDDDDDATDTTS